MHVAVGQTDQSRSNPSARPEDYVRISTGVARHGFMLQGNSLLFRNSLQARHHFGMIATAMSESRASPEFYVAVLGLADSRIICRVSDSDHECHVWVKGIGNF